MKRKTKLYFFIGIPICICLEILLIVSLINRMKNPYRVEIQQLIEEAGIEDLQVQMAYGNDVLIGITFEGNEEFYRSEKVYSEVDKVQKIVVSFINSHPEAFNLNYKKDYSGELCSKFEIMFVNSDVISSHPNRLVFSFRQVDEKLQENAKGMNLIIIRGGDRYKMSCLTQFPDIKEFNCCEMILDDEDVVSRLQNAKRINLYGVTGGNQRQLIKNGKRNGIEVESDDLPIDDETNYEEVKSRLK